MASTGHHPAGIRPGRLSKIKSDRLCLKEATVGDNRRIHGIFSSNPCFLSLRRDIADSPAGYDLESVARYCETAMFDAARHLLIAVDKTNDDPIGLIDFVEASPADGHAWIGLILVGGQHHRQGYGSEMVRAICRRLESTGRSDVRVAVLEDNQPGKEFLERLGFSPYDAAEMSTTPETGPAILMQKEL